MENHNQLTELYKQNLENDIILNLAHRKEITIREAFDIYYSSRLAEQIEQGICGNENLDAKYLAEDLIENESELFNTKES